MKHQLLAYLKFKNHPWLMLNWELNKRKLVCSSNLFFILCQNCMLHMISEETNFLCIELRNVECTSFTIQHSLWYLTTKYEEGDKTKQRSCIGFNCQGVVSGVGGLQGWCLWGVTGATQCWTQTTVAGSKRVTASLSWYPQPSLSVCICW